MKHYHKIAFIGATGKAGKFLLKHLISHNFKVKLLLRHPDKFEFSSPQIEIVSGDARDSLAVQALVSGCDAVFSTLGQPKGEPPIFSDATTNIINAMKRFDVKRYILTTGLNVDTPSDAKGTKTQSATDWMKANYPATTNDKQLEFQILAASDIDWTLVRLPWITQTDERLETLVSLEDCPGEKISSTGRAFFLIKQVSDDRYLRKAPFIANS